MSRGCQIALAAVVGFMALASVPAHAERIISSLSNHRVMVTSNFTGEDLVLFGSVERDNATDRRKGGYDIVVTVIGPRESERTRRKERVLGIWVNMESRAFIKVPSYLAVLSSKPVDAIASSDTLRRLQVGLDNVMLPQRIGPDVADVVHDDPFRVAFLRLKEEHGLYIDDPGGVTFLTPTLFRAGIPLPANVPFGTYEVDVKLFADGALVAQSSSALEIIKAGFEQLVADAARDHALLYGLATAALALLTGWLASVVFRRD
jgi:uncharacterized protein (TIGR02186 family)